MVRHSLLLKHAACFACFVIRECKTYSFRADNQGYHERMFLNEMGVWKKGCAKKKIGAKKKILGEEKNIR
jgi:hypothetical protein